MHSFLARAHEPRRTLVFSSAMHVWSDFVFALHVFLLPYVKEDLGLSFKEVGLLRSAFGGALAAAQIPVGFLGERLGEFWPLIWGNVWVSAGLVAMALSPFFLLLLPVTLVGGLGGGTQHPLASSMVSRAYDARGRSTAVGTVNFAGDIGKIIAPAVVILLAVSYGWRPTMWIVGLVGLGLMALSMLARRGVEIAGAGQDVLPAAGESHEETRMGGFVALSGVGFLDSATRGAAVFLLPFVMEARDLSPVQVNVMLMLLLIGGAAGKFGCGWLGDRYGAVGLIWGTKGMTALLLALSPLTTPLALAPLMIVLGIGLNGTSSVLYATVAEFVPPRRRARLYSIYYTTNEGGAITAPLVYGALADVLSLKVTMLIMAVATAVVLPVSLTLGKHLALRVVESGNPRA